MLYPTLAEIRDLTPPPRLRACCSGNIRKNVRVQDRERTVKCHFTDKTATPIMSSAVVDVCTGSSKVWVH